GHEPDSFLLRPTRRSLRAGYLRPGREHGRRPPSIPDRLRRWLRLFLGSDLL
ncbi:MAG: hypothetical protein AVDCRST_MAG91-1899, partial [uncultured Sphingomonadaceae bacterium]